MKIRDSGRGLVRCLALAAAAMLALSAAGSQRAEALSLINPAAMPTAKYASNGLTTEVRGGHGHGGHGGGAAFPGPGVPPGRGRVPAQRAPFSPPPFLSPPPYFPRPPSPAYPPPVH